MKAGLKVGDKRQATILGIIALLAVGMLGKTALGSFSSSGSNQPIQVRDLGSPGATSHVEKADSVSAISTQPNRPTIPIATSAKQGPEVIVRDAFSKPDLPVKTRSFREVKSAGQTTRENQTETVTPAPVQGVVAGGSEGSLPQGKAATQTDQSGDKPANQIPDQPVSPPKKPKIIIRFDGYVEAGSPMGVISINGKSMSVRVGETLDNGFTIESIAGDHITIRKAKIRKAISIGKETEF